MSILNLFHAYRSSAPIALAFLSVALGYTGCSYLTVGVLKNETGDTVHLSISGFRKGFYEQGGGLSLCDCPMTIDSLGGTARIALPPDSTIDLGYTHPAPRDYHKPRRGGNWRDYLRTGFDSVRIVGPRYVGSFNDSTITTLPLEEESYHYIFMLRANR